MPNRNEPDNLERSILSLAAEYATATELCRRKFYVQLTLGNLKRTDLLLYAEHRSQLARIEVKAKQGQAWPACRGISGRNSYLVFVDFFKKHRDERPDFYILSADDWLVLAKRLIKRYRRTHQGHTIQLKNGVPTFPGGGGKPWLGIAVRVADIVQYREKWSRFPKVLSSD